MVHVLIIGGGGMIGQKIARRLAENGLEGAPVSKVTLFDIAIPKDGASHDVAIEGSLGEGDARQRAIEERPEVILHLAAVVSGAAEKDFSLGWRVNVFDMWHLLEDLRYENQTTGYRPRFVFASSCAVYGGPMPLVIPDNFHAMPQSSYGAQKVVGENYVSDFSRKGFIDGLSLRLPTICVRPGLPNAAASSCFSGIIREPLAGKEAVLPLPEETVHMFASPRSAAGFFTKAAVLDTTELEGVRVLNPPSMSCTIAEQIEALRQVAGEDAVKLIRRVSDPDVEAIVSSWPTRFAATRARALGFEVEARFEEIIQTFIEDDMPSQL